MKGQDGSNGAEVLLDMRLYRSKIAGQIRDDRGKCRCGLLLWRSFRNAAGQIVVCIVLCGTDTGEGFVGKNGSLTACNEIRHVGSWLICKRLFKIGQCLQRPVGEVVGTPNVKIPDEAVGLRRRKKQL